MHCPVLAAWFSARRSYVRGQAGRDVTAIEDDDLFAYFNEGYGSAYSPNTKRLHVVQTRAAYNYAHKKGWVTVDPFVDFEMPKLPDPKQEILLLYRDDPCLHWVVTRRTCGHSAARVESSVQRAIGRPRS